MSRLIAEGSTPKGRLKPIIAGWWDLRRQRDQAKAWIRNTPAKRSLESDDEDDEGD